MNMEQVKINMTFDEFVDKLSGFVFEVEGGKTTGDWPILPRGPIALYHPSHKAPKDARLVSLKTLADQTTKFL